MKDRDAAPEDIPVVILAGGMGMRLREETDRLPKPMVAIGERPILWHIMKLYRHHGFRRFVICLGYKGWIVKDYFLTYRQHLADLRVQLNGRAEVELLNDEGIEDWEITLAETGLATASVGRLARVARYLDAPRLAFTYGDGVADVDLTALLAHHRSSGLDVTVTGVKPQSRYGLLAVAEDLTVREFSEKPEVGEGYASGGFFLIEREVVDELPDAPDAFIEDVLLPRLVAEGRLGMYPHHGYWHAMDTYRDFEHLNAVWASGEAPWAVWKG